MEDQPVDDRRDIDIVTLSFTGANDNSPLEMVSADRMSRLRSVEEAAVDVEKTKRAFDDACQRLFEAMRGN